MATPAQTLNLSGVLSETKRIINAHSRHFLALSVIFLLPISFTLIIYPTLQSTLSHQPNPTNPEILLRLPAPSLPSKTLIVPIVFTIFIALLSVCAVGTITYSTYHGFYGRPVKIGSAIKSLLRSFIPLVSTALAAQIVASVITFLFLFGLHYFLIKGAGFLGFNVEYESDCYNWLQLVVMVALVLVLISFQVHCGLACVIVVAESKWGFAPLWRSAKLVKGMRLVSLWLLLFLSITVVFPLLLSSAPMVNFSGGFDLWRSGAFILLTVSNSSFVTLFMLVNFSANTVLYMYCKALHGELAFDIAEEFAREYVSLPFDNDKVPHIVTVVQT